MSVINRFQLKWLLFIILISATTALASGWFSIFEDASWPKINGIAIGDNSLQNIYLVGDNGSSYFSDQAGYDWQLQATGTTENLSDIALGRDWSNNGVRHLVAVGENGTVLHFSESTNQWQTVTGLGQENFNAAYYEDAKSAFWIGGNNGQLFVSFDFGVSWTSRPIDPNLQLRKIHSQSDGALLFAEKNDTTFVLRENALSGFFLSQPGDTLPNLHLVQISEPLGEYSGTLLIMGMEPDLSNTHIFQLSLFGQGPIQEGYVGDLGVVTGFTVYAIDYPVLWVTTRDGRVLESVSGADGWQNIYTDPQNRALGPIISSDWSEDLGRMIGAGGLVFKYGFELLSAKPENNRNILPDFNPFEISFSLIPDLNSVNKGIWIRSNQRGNIPFNSEFNPADSTQVMLTLQSDFGPELIPGEKLNISFSDSLKARSALKPFDFGDLNFTSSVVSNRSTSFQFNDFYRSQAIGKPTTNWVNGFVNQDDILDFITFADDTLYCFMGAPGGNYDQLFRLPFANLISLRVPPSEQIILRDLDMDGLPDLLLYDQSDIYLLKNVSSSTEIIFSGPTLHQSEEFINKLVLYNENNNATSELMILGTRFGTMLDLQLDSLGPIFNNHDFGTISHLFVDVADLNGDGRPDMMLVDNDGQLILREGNGNGFFNDFNQVLPAAGRSYTGVKAANLNDDDQLEILAYNSTYVDLIVPTVASNWDFTLERQNVISTWPDPILDLYIQDFGGSRDADFRMRPDILALTPDSILFFENESVDQTNLQFVKLQTYTKPIDLSFDKLIAGDYDQDGTLDFTAYDVTTGQFNIWNKFTWQPLIELYQFHNHRIDLSWSPFPIEAGTADYYNVYRSNSEKFDQNSYIRQTPNNQFIDFEVDDYENFWYRVQAVYNGGIKSDWSTPVNIQTYIELNGPQSGVLDDTSRVYLAKSSLSVEAGSSLEVQGGVRIGFEPNMQFNIYGNLQVKGSNPDEQMVSFEPVYQDSAWNGLVVYPGIDTVGFDWFSIQGAKTGIQINGRPLKMQYGGINNNALGVLVDSDTLSLENVVFDSNRVALQVRGNTHASVKNANIFHSQQNSIVGSDGSVTGVRNAIIWENSGPVIKEHAGAFIGIKYSTVDNIGQGIVTNNINQLTPIFMPPDSGYFRPDIMSPTIDAGDPGDAFDAEPPPNGGRINQGLFGGSFLATPSIQPRIQVNPAVLHLVVRPGFVDSAKVWIKNPGGSSLDILSIVKIAQQAAFQLLGPLPASVAPGDSVPLNILFSPSEVMDYRDTLRIVCNDPHLAGGILDVALLGKGSDVVPVVWLDPLKDATLRESAVRFWYSVADSGSESVAPAVQGSFLVRYRLTHLFSDDSVVTGVRINEEPLDFFPLDDGVYQLKIWANQMPSTETAEIHPKKQIFTVNVKKRTALALRWHMVSLPRSIPVDWQNFNLGDSSAYLLKWDNQREEYLEINPRQIEPGQAFWTFPFKRTELDLALVDAAHSEYYTGLLLPKPLESGWNQVGVPKDFSLFWTDMKILPTDGTPGSEISFEQAVEAKWIDGVVYHFIQNSDYSGYDWEQVDSTTRAEPWAGYWLKTTRPCSIIYPLTPAFEQNRTSSIVEPVSATQDTRQENDWLIDLQLENANYRDAKNILGVSRNPVPDVSEPPHIGDYCALFVPSKSGALTRSIYSGFSDYKEVKEWNLTTITRNNRQPHTISWKLSGAVEDVYLYMVDLEQEKIVDLHTTNNYTFTPTGNSRLFKVYAAQDENFHPEIVPLVFKLEQNYPNPFNPQTTIRFGVPLSAADQTITLTVYDVLGRKITELFKGQMDKGYHQLPWNGRNSLGKLVASGVYFYRLQAGKKHLVRKMILVR